MKQAQRMQQQMLVVQEGLAKKTVAAASGGGTVKVVVSCDGNLQSIKLDPDAVNKDDATFLEDLILKAVNEGLAKAREISNQELGSVSGGMQIPGMF